MRVVATSLLVLLAAISTVSAFDAYKLLLTEMMDATCPVAGGNGLAPNFNLTEYEMISVNSKPTNYSIEINPCLPTVTECGQATLGSYLTLAAAKGGQCISFDTEVTTDAQYEASTVTLVFNSSSNANAKATVIIRCGSGNLTFLAGNLTGSEAVLEFESDVPCKPNVNTPTPAPAPPGDSDDGSKLSTGAVVGIIAGSAVVVVSLGVAITKFRASSKSDDGTYSRV